MRKEEYIRRYGKQSWITNCQKERDRLREKTGYKGDPRGRRRKYNDQGQEIDWWGVVIEEEDTGKIRKKKAVAHLYMFTLGVVLGSGMKSLTMNILGYMNKRESSSAPG